jgi:hypothetical protein
MLGLTFTFLGCVMGFDLLELPQDVVEIQTRQFAMPLNVASNRQQPIQRVRLFISRNQGKTWTHHKDFRPTDNQVTFQAERDGLFWFALQVEFKDGKSEPTRLADLAPAMKVFVNQERKALKPPKSSEELRREVEDLQSTVEQLQKRIKELEGARKPKLRPDV